MTILTKHNELGLQNRNLGLTFGAGLSARCTTLYDKYNIRREYLIVFLLVVVPIGPIVTSWWIPGIQNQQGHALP